MSSQSQPPPNGETAGSTEGNPGLRFLDRRAFVLDPETQSLEIKKTKDIKAGKNEYWIIELLPVKSKKYDCWDIFLDDDDSNKDPWAVNATVGAGGGYLISRLNLQRLGIFEHFLRRKGALDTVYIAKEPLLA